MKRIFLIILIAPLLAGCMQTFTSSVAGSCSVFERPPFAVKGATQYDQDVADNFVESGVAGCNWPRPAARPASIEVPIARKPVAAPVKRRGLVQRIRDRVAPRPAAAAPIAPTAPAPPAASLELAPESPRPQPAPRRPIDELLWPSR